MKWLTGRGLHWDSSLWDTRLRFASVIKVCPRLTVRGSANTEESASLPASYVKHHAALFDWNKSSCNSSFSMLTVSVTYSGISWQGSIVLHCSVVDIVASLELLLETSLGNSVISILTCILLPSNKWQAINEGDSLERILSFFIAIIGKSVTGQEANYTTNDMPLFIHFTPPNEPLKPISLLLPAYSVALNITYGYYYTHSSDLPSLPLNSFPLF